MLEQASQERLKRLGRASLTIPRRNFAGVLAVGLCLRIALSLGGVSELSISVLTPCRVDTLIVGALLALVARREPGAATELVRRAGKAAVVLGAAVFAVSAWCATTHLFLPVLHQVRARFRRTAKMAPSYVE